MNKTGGYHIGRAFFVKEKIDQEKTIDLSYLIPPKEPESC